MESTQVLECTQTLEPFSGIVEENPENPVKVATLTVEGVDYDIWNRENIIGRDAKCSIVLNSKAVSVEHAIIEADLHGGHFICDLGSTNKTKLGNVQLKPRVKYFINDGDSLKIANLKGVYRHENLSTCQIPSENATPSMAELTEIPGTPERSEEEAAVASIINETPCKDEGNEAASSDGDIFGDTGDSSAIFLGSSKPSSAEMKSEKSEIDSGELLKTDESINADRVAPIRSEVPKDLSLYAVASQSVSADQSSVLEGGEQVNESSVCDADSSDLVLGSQPMFTPEKRLYEPRSINCDTVSLEIAKEKDKELSNKSEQWDNIDDSIDEISSKMDSIDSMVENNSLQITYTSPKRKSDESNNQSNDISNTIDSSKPDDEVSTFNSPPSVTKIITDKIHEVVEGLGDSAHGNLLVKGNNEFDQKLAKTVDSDNDDKRLSVYELATQEIVENLSAAKKEMAAAAGSSVDESTDIVVGSQPFDSSEKKGVEADMFNVDTVPMECAETPPEPPKVDVFELETQQMCSESGGMGNVFGDDPNFYDLPTQPFVVPSAEKKNVLEEQALASEDKFVHSAEVRNQEEADISISDLPTQGVQSSGDRIKIVDHKLESVHENIEMKNCDVSISDLATQSILAPTNQEKSKLSNTDISTDPFQKSKNDERLSKLIEEEDPHDVSLSDMDTQATSVVKTKRELLPLTLATEKERIELDKEDCNMSISDMATQQSSAHLNNQKELSEPQNTNSSVLPCSLTLKSENKVPNVIKVPHGNDHQDSEDIYNIMTQLPVGSNCIVLDERSTQLENSEVKVSSHETSISEMSTQPNRVESDEMQMGGISSSKLPSLPGITEELNHSESLKNENIKITNEDTEDIFNVETQLPIDNDNILLEESNTQLINSEVERAKLDESLSDMMTQPAKSASDVTRENPVLEMSISDLPTQTAAAEIKGVVDQDSEDIYNVMTQVSVEKENILLDESDTQQINSEENHCGLKVVGSVVKQISEGFGLSTEIAQSTPASVESSKNNEKRFKIPITTKDIGKKEVGKGEIDICMMDTQPMDFQVPRSSNLVDDRGENDAITVSAEVLHSDSDKSIYTIATQDTGNRLPNNHVIDKDAQDDVFEANTVPLSDPGEGVIDKPEDTNGCNIEADDLVVSQCSKKATSSSFGEHSVASATQEIDPNSVEGRIRALSDKNVNSFATQQVLVSSNTKSTVAELLETLEDTSSQVIRNKRKVKKLDYSDSEDSESPVIMVQRKAKALPESDDEKETLGNDEIVPGNIKMVGNEPERASSDVLCNGKNDKLPSKSTKEDPFNVVDNVSSKITNSEASEDHASSDAVEGKKSISVGDSKVAKSGLLLDHGILTPDKVSVLQKLEGKTTEIHVADSNNSVDSESLQLHLSADTTVNKTNDVSSPTTPSKEPVSDAVTVTPTAEKQNLIVKVSPDTPEIPKDFFGTPICRDKPVLRQYVNKKKLSLGSSLLTGPNASSTPKSEMDSCSVIETEETLQSPKTSLVNRFKVDEKDSERNSVDDGSNALKNVKKFKKASPQKRKSTEVVDVRPEEDDFLSSQESIDSQEFGRGKRKKVKKSYFGFDEKDNEPDSLTTMSLRKNLESEDDCKEVGLDGTSSMKPPASGSCTDRNKINSGEKTDKNKKRKDEVTPKRQYESELDSSVDSSLKKVKLSEDIKSESRLTRSELIDMELTCVNRLQESVKGPVINEKFKRSPSGKKDPLDVIVIPMDGSDVKPAKSCETISNPLSRRRNVSTPQLDSDKDIRVPHSKKDASDVSASTSGTGPSSKSPIKSVRGRKRADVKNSNSEQSLSSIQKSKRNRVQNVENSSQELADTIEEKNCSQGESNLQGVTKINKKHDEEKTYQLSNLRSQQNSRNSCSQVVSKEAKRPVEANISDNAAARAANECSTTPVMVLLNDSSNKLEEVPTSIIASPKKVVTRRGRPRKFETQKEERVETVELSSETISNVNPGKVPPRMGRRKVVKSDEEPTSIPDVFETQSPASTQEFSPPKRGRKGRTDNSASVTKEQPADKPKASQSAGVLHDPSTSKTNVSKTRARCRTPATMDDFSGMETDQDSQSQDLSQGRRSGRERKKKETFDEIMSRKEEEIRLKKLERNSALSQSPDKSRSTSRASIASSKIEDDEAVTKAPSRRGRPKKSASVASTSSILSVNEASTFTVPASIPSSPAGSNSSRRRTPRSGSASSSQSVESLSVSTKRKQESQKAVSASPVKVMFTGLADAKLSSMVKKLGGKVVEKPIDCTVLVTDKVRRTVKFLCALGLGKPIVSPNWLSKSKAFNQFTDPNASLLKDSEAEEKFDFQLNDSLKKARESRLLEGYSFFATASVLPPPAEIKPIVECSGGTYLAKPPAKWPSNAAIISSPKDKSGWTKLSKHGVLPPILSAEALLSGVLQQQFDLGKHRLK